MKKSYILILRPSPVSRYKFYDKQELIEFCDMILRNGFYNLPVPFHIFHFNGGQLAGSAIFDWRRMTLWERELTPATEKLFNFYINK